ncbi:hypothetical protein NEUTE2DRAFT_81904 [Neurospora tetrasperma FGSC 2509]|nr:hypothetical protein NEUTE2DRAFT_81904 [Neurospora tetrasperma FGSC 2509]
MKPLDRHEGDSDSDDTNSQPDQSDRSSSDSASEGGGDPVYFPEEETPVPQASTDPTTLWQNITNDPDLRKLLKDWDEVEKTGKLEKDNSQNQPAELATPDQAKLEALRHEKEEFYRPEITKCIQQSFIHTVMEHATATTLQMTLFLLGLILEQEPDQICSSRHAIPILHQAIDVEVNKEPVRFRGFTSRICKLVDDSNRSAAIAMRNAKEENCLHLVVRHNIHDAKGIISSVSPNSQPNAFTQRRKSAAKLENGNTPLHDALHFERLGRRTIPCQTKELKQSDWCDECKRAAKANKYLPEFKGYYHGIIKELVKGYPDVLKQHNSAGHPPYTFHLETRTQSVESLKRLSQDPPTATTTLTNSKNKGADGQASRPKAKGKSGNDFKLGPRANSWRLDKPPEKDHPNEPINSKTRTEEKHMGTTAKDPNADEDGQKESEGAIEKHKEPWQYDSGSLENSGRIVSYLENNIHDMSGGYEDMIRCFFQDTDTRKTEAQNKQSRPKDCVFRLPTRVTHRTTNNYDFLKFESRLALVSLSLRPELLDSSSNVVQSKDQLKTIADNDAANIIKVFRWLKDKGVTKILKLVVDDNPDRVCSEEAIEKCLECMDEIRFLDWDRPDLAVPTIKKARRLIELSLYSTGTNAVLHHWSDQNGLVQLPKGLETPQRNIDNLDKFKKRLKKRFKTDKGQEIDVVIDKTDMEGSGNTPSGKDKSQGSPTKASKHAGFEAAGKFALALKNMQRAISTGRKVKVALMDDGVNPEYSDLGTHLACNGFPQSSLDGRLAPFYTSTKGHGSKMAWIISSLCPFVEILVAKIDNQDHPGDLPNPELEVDQAVSAVRWALDEGADIISMSWNFKVTPEVIDEAELLRKMLDKSTAVVYCAARDNRGSDPADTRYYPAECETSQKESLRKIGAATTYNLPQKYVTPDKTDYIFPSENVLPGAADSDGGNSVATAVAAGVAALVLHCLREDKALDRLVKSVTPAKLLNKVFTKLQDSGTKYVDLAELFTCKTGEVPNPRLLVNRVLVHAGLIHPDVESSVLRETSHNKTDFSSYLG